MFSTRKIKGQFREFKMDTMTYFNSPSPVSRSILVKKAIVLQETIMQEILKADGAEIPELNPDLFRRERKMCITILTDLHDRVSALKNMLNKT
jgi:hypothetical protein